MVTYEVTQALLSVGTVYHVRKPREEDVLYTVRGVLMSPTPKFRLVEGDDGKEVGTLTGNFIKLVTANRRLFVIQDIIKAFRALAAKARGEISAEVTSAFALNDAQVASLKETLKASVGKDVTLQTRVDPSILGGLIVKVGSRMIDSSLKTKLQNLKVALNGAGA